MGGGAPWPTCDGGMGTVVASLGTGTGIGTGAFADVVAGGAGIGPLAIIVLPPPAKSQYAPSAKTATASKRNSPVLFMPHLRPQLPEFVAHVLVPAAALVQSAPSSLKQPSGLDFFIRILR